MSHEAFLRTIIAQPDDDLPRLVYADWLDENDDPARAEFIRVQCELAHLPDDAERRPMLEDREHELLSEHEPAWLGSELVGLQEWEFQRGFLHSVTASLDDLMSYPDSFHELTTVRDYTPTERIGKTVPKDLLRSPFLSRLESLDLTRINHSARSVGSLLRADAFPAMKRLDFTGKPRLCDYGASLKRWPVIRQVEALSLGVFNGPYGGEQRSLDVTAFVKMLRKSQLSELTLVNCGIDTEALRTLLSSHFAANLKSLDISHNWLDHNGWQPFHNANQSMRLKHLGFSPQLPPGDGQGTNDNLGMILEQPCTENLTDLDLDLYWITDKDIEHLANSRFWSQATRLSTFLSEMSFSKLEILCKVNGPPNLKYLNLAHSDLRTTGIQMLCHAPWSSSLNSLGLIDTKIDDDSVKLLAESNRFQRLKTLQLNRNNATPDGISKGISDLSAISLAEASSMKNLRMLLISSSKISRVGIEAIFNSPHWQLTGLWLLGCDFSNQAIELIATSPRLARMNCLNLACNPQLAGNALLPLAESPYLSRLCELDIGHCGASDRVRQILRERLGPRLSD